MKFLIFSLIQIFSVLSFAFAANSPIKISIHHGYLDGYPETTQTFDGIDKNEFKKYLTTSCKSSSYKYLCGYTSQTNQYGEILFTRTFQTHHGDQTVEVREYSASLTSSDTYNKAHLDQQNALTQRETDLFHQAFGENDIVVYTGHSRYGGGPDFGRPVLTREKTHDVNYYLTRFTGFKDMVTALRKAPKHPSYVGMYSCDSKKHFEKELTTDFPDIKFFLTLRPINSSEDSAFILHDVNPILRDTFAALDRAALH